MKNAGLPEKFRFREQYLDDYVQRTQFPFGFMADVEGGEPKYREGGYDPKHSLSGFMGYLIRVRVAEEEGNPFMDPKKHWLREKALIESIYLDQQAGALTFAKPLEYLKENDCIGAIDVYAEFVAELNKAVEYVQERGIQTSEYPFDVLLRLRDEANKNLLRFQTRDTKGMIVVFVESDVTQ